MIELDDRESFFIIVIFVILFFFMTLFVGTLELSKSQYEEAYTPCSSTDLFGDFDTNCVPRSDFFLERLDSALSRNNKLTNGSLWLIGIQDYFHDSEPKLSEFKKKLLLDRGIE